MIASAGKAICGWRPFFYTGIKKQTKAAVLRPPLYFSTGEPETPTAHLIFIETRSANSCSNQADSLCETMKQQKYITKTLTIQAGYLPNQVKNNSHKSNSYSNRERRKQDPPPSLPLTLSHNASSSENPQNFVLTVLANPAPPNHMHQQ